MRKMFLVLMLVLVFGTIMNAEDTLFYDDFESGELTEWSFDDAAFTARWHITDFEEAYEGNSWWCAWPEARGYDDEWLQHLTTPAVVLPAGGSPTFSFQINYDIEEAADFEDYDSWDGVNVRISTDGTDYTVIEPDGGYPYNSMYGFGYNGEGTDVPGWGGASGGWVEKTFDLSEYAGETVYLRIVFGSDPGFCTINKGGDADSYDETMYGVLVDDITVADGTTILFFDDAGDTEDTEMTFGSLLSDTPHYWSITDAEAYEGTHSLWFGDELNINSFILTPVIHVPDSFKGYIDFFAYCDLPDYLIHPDSSSLADFWQLYVWYYNEDDGTYYKEYLTHNYWNPPFDTGFGLIDDASIFAGSLQLNPYLNKDIRIALRCHTDGDHLLGEEEAVGEGVFIDNFNVHGRTGLMHNVRVARLSAGPINIDEPIQFTATLENPGLSEEASIMTLYRTYTADWADTLDIGFFAYPTIASDEKAQVSTSVEFDEADDYRIRVYVSRPGDMNSHDDTLDMVFSVPSSHDYEIGYDDGDPFESETVFDFVAADFFTDVASAAGIGHAIACESPLSTSNLRKVKFFAQGTADVDIVVYSLDDDDRPYDVLTRFDGISVDLAEGGEWYDFVLPVPYELPTDRFAIAIEASEEDNFIEMGCDFTAPHGHQSFFRFMDPDAGLHYWFKLAPGEAAEFLDSIDFMIRAYVRDDEAVEEKVIVPLALGLDQNAPNPFNPECAISFQLDKAMDISLKVYDINGREIATLVEGNRTAGAYKVHFNGSNMPSGVYMYKLTTPDKTFTKKMLLAK